MLGRLLSGRELVDDFVAVDAQRLPWAPVVIAGLLRVADDAATGDVVHTCAHITRGGEVGLAIWRACGRGA